MVQNKEYSVNIGTTNHPPDNVLNYE